MGTGDMFLAPATKVSASASGTPTLMGLGGGFKEETDYCNKSEKGCIYVAPM